MDINATLIGQMITFAIFIIFTMKFIWPPLMKALEARRKKIADGLAAAERGQHDLQVARHKAKEIVYEAKAQAAVIVEQANQRAHKIDEAAREEARQNSDRMKQAATAEIEQQRLEAQQALREKVADLVVQGTERLLKKNIDKAANEALLKDLVKEMG